MSGRPPPMYRTLLPASTQMSRSSLPGPSSSKGRTPQENTAAKVAEVFLTAGHAFSKLGDLALELHFMPKQEPGVEPPPLTEENIDQMQAQLSSFADDLDKISERVQHNVVSQARIDMKRQTMLAQEVDHMVTTSGHTLKRPYAVPQRTRNIAYINPQSVNRPMTYTPGGYAQAPLKGPIRPVPIARFTPVQYVPAYTHQVSNQPMHRSMNMNRQQPPQRHAVPVLRPEMKIVKTSSQATITTAPLPKPAYTIQSVPTSSMPYHHSGQSTYIEPPPQLIPQQSYEDRGMQQQQQHGSRNETTYSRPAQNEDESDHGLPAELLELVDFDSKDFGLPPS